MTQLGEWTARDRKGKESGEVRREHGVDLVSRPGVRVTTHNSCYNSVDQMSRPSRWNWVIYKNYSTLPGPAVVCGAHEPSAILCSSIYTVALYSCVGN